MHRAFRVRPTPAAALLGTAVAVVTGCTGTPTALERSSREDLAAVTSEFRPGDGGATLPELTPASTLADLLRFAMLNNPRVEAAYFRWAAGVERITTARSMPDPRLTFEADITDTIGAVMPGLMLDLPGPGKLRAAGDVAAGDAAAGYFAFEQEVLRTALAVKSAYFRLHFLEDTLRVERETLALLDDLEQIARAQNVAGRVTLQDVLRAQIDREQLATQIESLGDSRSVLLAELKAALGLGASDADPPVPARFEAGAAPEPAERVLAAALGRNPSLRAIAADVRRAEAMLDLADAGRIPDFSVGIDADLDANPVMWRPSASITLPIWRDKIAAEIAAAQAEKRSAEARLTAEQVSIAAELASMLALYRESARNEALLERELIPRARQSLDIARAGYTAGRSSFLDLIDAQRQLLAFQLSLVEARAQRELTLASISLGIVGAAPADAPVLSPTPLDTAAGSAAPGESSP